MAGSSAYPARPRRVAIVPARGGSKGVPGKNLAVIAGESLTARAVRCARESGLFDEIARLLRPGGRGYIFEPLLRELHQMPDDYVRYTPRGFQVQLERAGLVYDRFIPEGGPFTAIAYCWTQALEYFPEEKRAEMERWFYGQHFPDLVAWDHEYGAHNLKRQHTTFPTAFGIFFHKP